MLHRYVFTFTLIFTFGLGQLGLLAHDISHINQKLAPLVQAQNEQSNSFTPQLVVTNDRQGLVNANNPSPINPQKTEYHACEKCVGFAGIALAMQQAVVSINIAMSSEVHIDDENPLSGNVNRLTPLARAPPSNLV